jgi:general secretion pathway protein I
VKRHAMSRQRGFSLLEVMLAFALLAVGLGILIAILGGGLTQVRDAGDASEATLHAQSVLDELGVLAPIEPGRQEGQSGDGRYRWVMDIRETEDPAPVDPVDPDTAPVETVGLQMVGAPVLYRVQLDIAWGEDAYARSLRFATLRARLPTPPAGALP